MNVLLVILFLNEFVFICLHTNIAIVCKYFKEFQVLLCNIWHQSIVCSQLNGITYIICKWIVGRLSYFFKIRANLFAHILNGFMYCYQTLIILFHINHLFVHNEGVLSIAYTNSFICTQLNDFKCCYLILIILLSINPLFVYNEGVSSIAHTNSFQDYKMKRL